ncbi:MAG: endo-1,4-beta-xylanase, partial [Paucibacter sp.]|nr:endo-1,4-beta-xylanase [Roseateles sp.]
GNAIGMKTFRDPHYRALMARECSTLVTENECKWPLVSPHAGAWNFGPADEIFAWGTGAGLLKRGHCLVWQPTKWLPQWVVQTRFGTGSAVAEKLLTARIKGMCAQYGQQVYSWDVVNEAIDPATGDYRENVFTKTMGAVEQIDLCFRLTRAGAPQAQLVYNDYMRWDAGSAKHRAGVLKLLHALKDRGTPIDALGLQSHIGPWDEAGEGTTPQREWRAFLDEVSGMGLQLLITEFDVNDRKLPADIAARDAGSAALARDYLDLTFSYANLTDFLFWGLTDNTSWLQTWRESQRADKLPVRPCPYDAELRAKPLREAVAAAIKAMPVRGA